MCGNCQRNADTCVYDRDRLIPLASHQPSIQSTRTASPVVDIIDEDRFDLSESRSRRIWELRLLNHYNLRTSQDLLISGDDTAAAAWVKAVPEQAFGNDALLFAMFAFSALHMSEHQSGDQEMIEMHRRYLALALSEHKKDVINLNESTFDAVLLTSTLLRVTAFALLRERPLVPYEPPILWLEMTRGTVNLFKESWKWIERDENSMAFRLTKRMPIVFDEEAKFAQSNREGLEHLLHRDELDLYLENWPPDVAEAYETTVSYLGCIMIAIKADQPSGEICRRLLLFPYIVRSRYIELVKEKQPRALAILGHYFALLSEFNSIWWIGGSGLRETQALKTVLPTKWHEMIREPHHATSLDSPGGRV